MKKKIKLIIILFISFHVYGQENKKLSEALWERAQNCYAMFEDSDGDGKVDYDEIIDDSKNGYLKVSGTYPTCGCTCESTIAAYKTNSDTYVFVDKNSWNCSWRKNITSSKSLNKIFPFDFESDGFFSKKIENARHHATFYLDIEIPKTGTDTKVSIKMIPFGLHIKSTKNIEFGYSEALGYSSISHYPTLIYNIVKDLQDEETLNHLLNSRFDEISNHDMKLINESVNDKNYFKNNVELIKYLKELKCKYDLYTKIKHESLVLGWNREKGIFYIKTKGSSPKKVSFLNFLKTAEYWSAMC